MTQANAAAGSFSIGGDGTVHWIGFGKVRVTGEGIWADPQNPEEAGLTLRRLPDPTVNFIDTADSYRPFISEHLSPSASGSGLGRWRSRRYCEARW